MKRVFFVRHGQSEGNAGLGWQPWDSPLTELGRKQAHFIADRCLKLPLDYLISSPFPRAKETAEIISQKINLPIEFSDLFVERRRPSEQIGAERTEDPIDLEIIKHWNEPEWHYSDEENFFDIKSRAIKALKFLEQKEQQHILVVSHGLFLRILLGCAMFGSTLTSQESEPFIRGFMTSNTGLTILTYNSENQRQPWTLLTWNDHAHLAE